MMKDMKRITFDELVAYGLACKDANIVNGMPWHFEYEGVAITHENDECYIIPTAEGLVKFTPEDVLVTFENGEVLYVRKVKKKK